MTVGETTAGESGGPRPLEPRPRAAGLLLHPTSLPGRGPIGDLGPAAHALLDWLVAAGLSHWQVLPVGPTGYGDSPYGALSSFAGNPLLVSPERLAAADLGTKDDSFPSRGSVAAENSAVDFAAARAEKQRFHRRVWARFRTRASAELTLQWKSFREGPARSWLADWTEYAALKERNRNRPWLEWDRELRNREPAAMAMARKELAGEIELHAFEQFLFSLEWSELLAEAAARGVRLIGDLPIYPALDSADVWARRELFELTREGRPARIAGVPPDYFAATGQRWGNPLYRWERHGADGYAWWVARLRRQLELFDLVRLDHFRGFVAYWSVPARAKTAAAGKWVPGPGRALFDAFARELGALPLLAEDLGEIGEPVHALRRELALPGMRVLQFGFGDEDSWHAPHRHAPDTVVYTGTHDNDTARGWLASAPEAAKRRALVYLGCGETAFPWAMVRAALTSVAELAVVPLQDLVGLGAEARLNTPGRESGNWSWRVRANEIPDDLAARVRELAGVAARRPPLPPARPPAALAAVAKPH